MTKHAVLDIFGEEISCQEVEKFREQLENVMLSNHQNVRDLIFVSEKLSNSVSSTTTASRNDDTKKVVRLRKLPNKLSNFAEVTKKMILQSICLKWNKI